MVYIQTSFSIAQPTTSGCGYAGSGIVVDGCPQTFNSNADTDYWNSATGCGASDRDDAWWWFTATSTSHTISYYSANDAILTVFPGNATCAASMASLACSDQFTAGGTESITITTVVGQNYAVRIQRYNSNNSMNGNITVTTNAFGNNVWNVFGYNSTTTTYNAINYLELALSTYQGFYTNSDLNINTGALWGGALSPSAASGWSGCAVQNDDHIFVYKRRGFPCGFYTLENISYDDAIRIYINGVQVYQNTTCCSMSGVAWSGALNSSSTVEIRVAEDGGGSNLQLNFNSTPFPAIPDAGVDQSICSGATAVLGVSAGSTAMPSGYCASSATNTADSRINRVRFNTIDNNTASGCHAFRDFTAVNTNVLTNNVYELRVNIGTCGGDYTKRISAWIDFNRNGVFDAGEIVMSNLGGGTGNQELVVNITIPSNASIGVTRMRLICIEGSTTDPCASYSYGETQDYSVTIQSSDVISWTGGPILSGGSTLTPTVNPTSTSVYTLTVSNSGCSATDDVTVTISNPTITGTTNTCVGSTSDLSAGEADWTSLPTGGVISTTGTNDRIHVFNSTAAFTTPLSISNAQILVVGGGGGGGNSRGGGGGGGGLILNTNFNIPSGSTTATVGNGGAASTAGENSTFSSLTAIGGGRGGSHLSTDPGGAGGSGGGAAMNYNTNIFAGGSGTAGQGFNGATSGNQGNDNPRNTGGGGGAGQAGTIGAGGNATWTSGTPPKGGDGLFISEFAGVGGFPAGWFAGGGGGARGGTDRSGAGEGVGGQGGGGRGGGINAQSNGVANTGGGGGGSEGTGATGGSGVIMIRYKQPKWTSSNVSIATVNELTGVVTGVAPGTVTITYYSPNGCTASTSFTVEAPSVAPVSISGGGSYCHGVAFNLTQNGGSLGTGASYQWFTGSCGGTGAGSGTSISPNPTTTTTYFVRASATTLGACPASACASTTITLPTAGTSLSTSGQNATCAVTGNNWIRFYETGSGNFIGAINPNNNLTSNVTMTSYVGSASSMDACTQPGNVLYRTAYMGRNWVITSSAVPTGSVSVLLPFTDGEMTGLTTAAGGTGSPTGGTLSSGNPNDNIDNAAGLRITKYSNPGSENGTPTDNCSAGTSTVINNSSSGNLTSAPHNYGIASAQYAIFPVSGFSEFYLHGVNSNSPLPVELISFSGTCTENGTELTWQTASESNNDYFIVQRSRDGINWQDLTTVSGNGNSTQLINYDWFDEAGFDGMYYRLTQVDFNGDRYEKQAIYVNCESESTKLNVYPNPTQADFTIEVNSTKEVESATISIIDVTGKALTHRNVEIHSGVNSFYFGDQLESGTYLIRVNIEGILQTLRLVVKN